MSAGVPDLTDAERADLDAAMAPAGRCETCRYWMQVGPFMEPVSICALLSHIPEPPTLTIKRTPVRFYSPYDAVTIFRDIDHEVYMGTAADFGCTLHEVKP